MKIDEVVTILKNRMITLSEARKQAVSSGNLEQVIVIDADVLSTELTIAQLESTIVVE